MQPDRRLVLAGAAAVVAGGARAAPAGFAELERRTGGRMGVYALDAGTGRAFGWREAERFPMCSTFKTLLAGAVLARVDAHAEQLDRTVGFSQADLLEYAPIARQHVAQGMTVGALCKAAIEVSDNTAANLLLKTVGGPPGLTAFIRTLGDRTTRLDRSEPTLNTAIPGDPRDTTTPRAMVRSLAVLLTGDRLSGAARQQLAAWMAGTTTGLERLRLGARPGWRAGDKTGSGANNTTNDVAYLWPRDTSPVLVCCYLTGAAAPMSEREAVMAEIGRRAAALSPSR